MESLPGHRRKLAHLSAEALAQQAVANTSRWFRRAHLELKSRPQAEREAAAHAVVQAYAAGTAPPFLTAALLGACRSRTGDATCLSILEADHQSPSESYASDAMVNIAGTDARADLIRVVARAELVQGREADDARGERGRVAGFWCAAPSRDGPRWGSRARRCRRPLRYVNVFTTLSNGGRSAVSATVRWSAEGALHHGRVWGGRPGRISSTLRTPRR